MGARKLVTGLLGLSLLLAGCAGCSRSRLYILNYPVYPAVSQEEGKKIYEEEIERQKAELREMTSGAYELEDRVIPVRILTIR